jgi:Peptidase family M28
LNAATPNDAELDAIARSHLRRLAGAPRPTSGAATARQYCGSALSNLGFRVREMPFEYSAAVGAYGTPAGGAAVCLVLIGSADAALGNRAAAALALLIVGGLAVALGGRWLAGHGVLALPFMRRHGVNLEATRGDDDPDVWLVAHVDSKSQPVPLLVRAAGIVLLAIAWFAAIALAIATMLGHAAPDLWRAVIVIAVVGAVPVLGSVVGNRSAGAVDNASGVATVLGAAATLPDANLGVLITDAEELGLAGARAWCAETTRRRVPVLNCDGVDDDGVLTLMWTHPRSLRVETVVRESSRAFGVLRGIPLVPGVLVDAVAFSDAGWESVTLSRGTLATLRRIHTRRDNLDHLEGRALSTAALTLAFSARALMEQH